MATQQFGSAWTNHKLGAVFEYAQAWATIMHSQGYWKYRYIDAFSGSGSYKPRPHSRYRASDALSFFGPDETTEEREEIQKGSALRAMELQPKFNQIDLIEENDSFAESLRKIAGDELGKRVFVHCEDVNTAIPQICGKLSSNRDRALVFIDPFGCEVWWDTLKAISDCKVADVFYLFPTMGINRQIPDSLDRMSERNKNLLDRVLGTNEWRTIFFKTQSVRNLFGEIEMTTRAEGPTAVERFFLEHLQTIFPSVHPECLRLKNSRNGHMFSLCFEIANPSPTAQRLANRIAGDVIKKWEAKA